jgi:hypothetical protein
MRPGSRNPTPDALKIKMLGSTPPLVTLSHPARRFRTETHRAVGWLNAVYFHYGS